MSINIPRRTRFAMAKPAPIGSRHAQAVSLAVSLIGQGLTPSAVFEQLRSMYDSDVTDHELRELIGWAVSRNPQPSNNAELQVMPTIPPQTVASHPKPKITTDQAISNAEIWLQGFTCEISDLFDRSPWTITDDWRLDSLMLLAALYDSTDWVNIVTDFKTTRNTDGDEKCSPSGTGRTLTRDEWMREIRTHGTPESEAGAWIRMNPCKPEGSGICGAICDSDVTAHRFALLESDLLPENLALSIYASLWLPVVSIHGSGGRGPHAWVRVECESGKEYREQVARIFTCLSKFGIDEGNKNPSRLSRLPGARRRLGAKNGGEQRLYYLNPEAIAEPIFVRRGL